MRIVNLRPWEREIVLTPADLEEGKRLLESAVVDSDGNLRITLKEAAHDSDATAPVRPAAA